MNTQMEMVAKALIGIMKKHNKNYCFVSQSKLQDLLKRYQPWKLSERTLRRRVKDLVDQGYIKVVHRNWAEVNGVKKFRSNLYIATKKLILWLRNIGEYICKALNFFRRPKVADYSSHREEEIYSKIFPIVEILWKSQKKGMASPLKAL